MKKRLTQTVRTIVFLALAFFLLWLSFKGTDFRELWAVLKKARYMWLLPAAVVSLLSFLIRARRWNLLIEPMGYKPSLVNAYHSVVTGYFANMIFPRLGEVAKCASLARKENRITSYNVCYTKLLRKNGACLAMVSSAVGRITSYNVCYTKLLRDKKHDIDLTYITSRGNWYFV